MRNMLLMFAVAVFLVGCSRSKLRPEHATTASVPTPSASRPITERERVDRFGLVRKGMARAAVAELLGEPMATHGSRVRYSAYSDVHHFYVLTIEYSRDVVEMADLRHYMEYPDRGPHN